MYLADEGERELATFRDCDSVSQLFSSAGVGIGEKENEGLKLCPIGVGNEGSLALLTVTVGDTERNVGFSLRSSTALDGLGDGCASISLLILGFVLCCDGDTVGSTYSAL